MNKLLLIGAAASVILAVILIPMIIFKPWQSYDPLFVAGKMLYLRVSEPMIHDQITFSSNSQSGKLTTFRIKPKNPNNKLAMVNIELTNSSKSPVKILIDEKSTELISINQDVFSPLNSILDSKPIENNERIGVVQFTPLWGSFELFTREKVKGSMVFEVPKDIVFVQFSWILKPLAVFA